MLLVVAGGGGVTEGMELRGGAAPPPAPPPPAVRLGWRVPTAEDKVVTARERQRDGDFSFHSSSTEVDACCLPCPVPRHLLSQNTLRPPALIFSQPFLCASATVTVIAVRAAASHRACALCQERAHTLLIQPGISPLGPSVQRTKGSQKTEPYGSL